VHDPDVLVLDEPTIGLDPRQIISVRELIKSLGGEHTVVLSTHILPEVSMTCGRVLIINKGKVVAEGTPDSLMHRLRGAAALRIEARGEGAALAELLRSVPGVKSVQPRPAEAGAAGSIFDVEAEGGRDLREAIARAVVQKGFGLLGLAQVGMSLEEIFLHLTTTDAAASEKAEANA
jgi:ABC-2 type transport system ATP-binding protein